MTAATVVESRAGNMTQNEVAKVRSKLPVLIPRGAGMR